MTEGIGKDILSKNSNIMDKKRFNEYKKEKEVIDYISNRLQERNSLIPIVKYTEIRKKFKDMTLPEFLDLLEELRSSGKIHFNSDINSWWSNNYQAGRNKNSIHREDIKIAKKLGKWDGVTIGDQIKYMNELDDYLGTNKHKYTNRAVNMAFIVLV